jgi:hypothetical protein
VKLININGFIKLISRSNLQTVSEEWQFFLFFSFFLNLFFGNFLMELEWWEPLGRYNWRHVSEELLNIKYCSQYIWMWWQPKKTVFYCNLANLNKKLCHLFDDFIASPPPQKKTCFWGEYKHSSQEGTGEANPKLGVKLRSGPIKLRKTSLIPCLFYGLVYCFHPDFWVRPRFGETGAK